MASGDTAETLTVDHYAAVLAYARAHARDPRALDRLDQILLHLRANGVACDDPRIPRYAEAALCRQIEERNQLRESLGIGPPNSQSAESKASAASAEPQVQLTDWLYRLTNVGFATEIANRLLWLMGPAAKPQPQPQPQADSDASQAGTFEDYFGSDFSLPSLPRPLRVRVALAVAAIRDHGTRALANIARGWKLSLAAIRANWEQILLLAEILAIFLAIAALWLADRLAATGVQSLPDLVSQMTTKVVKILGAPPPANQALTFWPSNWGWLLLLAGAIAWGLYILLSRRQWQASGGGGEPDTRPLAEVAVQQARASLFDAPDMREALRNLRRHRPMPSQRLDVRQTLRATIANAGFPSLRFATRPVSPEHIVLSEREMPNDHLPEVGLALAARLAQAQIGCAHYEFYGTPNYVRLVGERREAAEPEPLAAMLARHPGARLFLVMESFDIRTRKGGTPRWLAVLCDGAEPVLINPRDAAQWNKIEHALDELGLPSVAASPAGLADYSRTLLHRDAPDSGGEAPASIPDLPAFLAEHRDMLLSYDPPEPQFIDAIIGNLQLWLDRESMQWLRTLALFPILTSGYTFFSGTMAADWFSHTRYLKLSRLPWLRAAEMPDWLRSALVSGMSLAELDVARRIAQAYLLTKPGDAIDREALLARGEDAAARRDLVKQLAGGENPLLRDRYLLNALGGELPGNLGVEWTEEEPPPVQLAWDRLRDLQVPQTAVLLIAVLGALLWMPDQWRGLLFEPAVSGGKPPDPQVTMTPQPSTTPQPSPPVVVRKATASAQSSGSVANPSPTPAVVASADPLQPKGSPRQQTPDEIRQEWFYAISSGDIQEVQSLLASGKVELYTPVDNEGNTGLHLSAERCNIKMVGFFLQRGLDPTLENIHKDSPQTIALGRCGIDSPVTRAITFATPIPAPVSRVRERTSQVRGLPDTATRNKWSAAISAGDISAVRRMLASGAVKITTPVDDVYTSGVQLAAKLCNLPMVEFFVSNGADPYIQNAQKESAITIANAKCGADSPVAVVLAASAPIGPATKN